MQKTEATAIAVEVSKVNRTRSFKLPAVYASAEAIKVVGMDTSFAVRVVVGNRRSLCHSLDEAMEAASAPCPLAWWAK